MSVAPKRILEPLAHRTSQPCVMSAWQCTVLSPEHSHVESRLNPGDYRPYLNRYVPDKGWLFVCTRKKRDNSRLNCASPENRQNFISLSYPAVGFMASTGTSNLYFAPFASRDQVYPRNAHGFSRESRRIVRWPIKWSDTGLDMGVGRLGASKQHS